MKSVRNLVFSSVACLAALGTAAAQESGAEAEEPSLWERLAAERNVTLPPRYGVGLVYVGYSHDIRIEELRIASDDGRRGGIDFVESDDSEMTNRQLQLRADAWLLPFLNVFAQVGAADNTLSTNVSVDGEDIVAFVGDESRCAPDASPRPALCDQTFTAVGKQEPGGEVYTLGALLALGRGSYFALGGLAYTWADLDTADAPMETLALSPRVGRRFGLGNHGELAVYVGALHIDAHVEFSRSATVPTPNGSTIVTLTADITNKDPWSYVLGTNWDMQNGWNLQAELGHGASRDGFIASLTRRFP